MATMNVLNATGGTEAVEKPLAPGRAAATSSRPVVLSTEDLAAINALGTLLTTISGNVDGLEALLTAIGNNTDGLEGFTDGIETLLGTGNTSLANILNAVDGLEGLVDGLETLIGSTNTKLDSLITQGASTADVPVESHLPCDVVNYVPVLDTAAYAAGDVLAATAAISNITRVNDGRANLMSLTGIDKSKQKPAMTILFYQTNVTSAAANAANNLSDADQINLLGFQRILASDWIDYANNSICGFKGPTAPGILLEAASGTKNVYAVCILDAGTPTFAAGDLMFKLGVVQS